MKSNQLLRLQQQFLKSLHAGATQWLLKEIQPARGFSKAESVLSVYLDRAMGRTVDPLRQVYRNLRWLLGDHNFEGVLKRFYATSPGEPLNAQALATEFAAYLGEISDTEATKLLPRISAKTQAICSASQLICTTALLDWRLLWCSLAPARQSTSKDELLRILHHRCHLWSRPRLERGSRLCVSLVNLTKLTQLTKKGSHPRDLEFYQEPATFLIFADNQHETIVTRVDGLRERILNRCDGTHTIGSLIHEQSLYGTSREETMHELEQLICERIIVDMQSKLLSP